ITGIAWGPSNGDLGTICLVRSLCGLAAPPCCDDKSACTNKLCARRAFSASASSTGTARNLMRKSIFHEDWWLDALAPGRWREVTCLRGGRIAGSLRFVERSEAGMKICEMPQITRILGPVVTQETHKTEARSRSTHSIITELLH